MPDWEEYYGTTDPDELNDRFMEDCKRAVDIIESSSSLDDSIYEVPSNKPESTEDPVLDKQILRFSKVNGIYRNFYWDSFGIIPSMYDKLLSMNRKPTIIEKEFLDRYHKDYEQYKKNQKLQSHNGFINNDSETEDIPF